MKLTKKNLKKFAEESQSSLIKAVINDLLETPAADLENHLKDILKYGCINGTVSSMIYYADTLKFFEDHKNEIEKLLLENDLQPADLKDFDKEDPFVLETHNQNLMSWYAYEEVTYSVACYFGIC